MKVSCGMDRVSPAECTRLHSPLYFLIFMMPLLGKEAFAETS
jgi:hypothetical protein